MAASDQDGCFWQTRQLERPEVAAPFRCCGAPGAPCCGGIFAMVRVSVQGHFVDRTQWVQLAEAVDRSIFDSLYVADHPGSSAAPFVALAAAATVTHRVRLGTCVLNGGFWDPMTLAAELVTLDA